MTTYLLITSDKPTELTAFVGPKKRMPNINDYDEDCGYEYDCRRSKERYNEVIETAKASRLPVVNENITFDWYPDKTKAEIYGFWNKHPMLIKLDTPVELEGWEVEVVMSDGWQPTYNNPDNSGLEQPSEPVAYRLVRSEPVKELPEECQDPIASIGGCVFVGSSKNYCKKCVNESPIEVKTQESQEELWNDLINLYDTTDHSSYGYASLVKALSEKFILTRRNP